MGKYGKVLKFLFINFFFKLIFFLLIFCFVFKGEWKFVTVAVKQLKEKNLLDPNSLEEYELEVGFLSKLKHPNIVQFLGVTIGYFFFTFFFFQIFFFFQFFSKGKYWIIMEFCKRGSLFRLLRDHDFPLNWKFRKELSIDILKGIYYLHDLKIVHRDIKSSNILLDRYIQILKKRNFHSKKKKVLLYPK